MQDLIRPVLTAILLVVPLSAIGQTEAGFVAHVLFSGQPNTFVSIIAPTACPVTGCGPSLANHVNTGYSFEGFIAHRVVDGRSASLAVELPVLAMPNRGTDLGRTFSTVAVTPGLRANFLSGHAASPFLSAGGGIVHFSGDTPSATKGAGLVGMGCDFRTPVPHIGARIEVKDLITSWPGLFLRSGVMNNVVAGGGIVFKF